MTIDVTGAKCPTATPRVGNSFANKKIRQGKKRRMIIRSKFAAKKAGKLAVKQALADKKATQKEKRTKKNREKKVKKKDKEKLKMHKDAHPVKGRSTEPP